MMMIIIIAGAAGGGIVAFLILFIILCCYCCSRRAAESQEVVDIGLSGEVLKVEKEIYQTAESKANTSKKSALFSECSVCLDNFVNFKTNCGHYFHIQCILAWASKDNSCPYCRKPIQNLQHSLICKQCGFKSTEMTFSQFKNLLGSERYEELSICSTCNNPEILSD